MAPSNMFSYLRPGHNKRNASSPSLVSPEIYGYHDSNVSAPSPLPSPSLHPPDSFMLRRPPDNASQASSSPVSPYPPQLPPIPRVASRLDRAVAGAAIPVPMPQRPASQNSHPTDAGSQVAGDAMTRLPLQSTPEDWSSEHGPRRPASRPATSSHPSGMRPHGQSLTPVVSQDQSETPPSSSFLSLSTISSNYGSHSKSQTSLMSGLSDRLSSMSSTPTAPPQKSGRSRLNLRNPMSLLMRRRSGQPIDNLADESLVTHRSPSMVPPIPDNYDPSIRGRIVHDFSAPRTNRNFSYNNAHGSEKSTPGVGDNAGEAGRVSPQKIERGHTPVFREHFDDDTSYEQSQAAVRAENLANKDFVSRNSWQPPPQPPGRSPPPPPPLPKDSPPVSPPQLSISPPPLHVQPPFEYSLLSPVREASSPTEGPAEETPKKRKSTKTPPATRSRAASVTDSSFEPAGLPAHHTSKSSRFSFQIAGNDSAQEKVLEERHMRKAAEKASKQARMSTNTLDDEYDEYGMDDYDMDDGLEEDIPMLGDDDGFDDQAMSPAIAAFDFSSLSLSVPNNNMSPGGLNGEVQTPRDANGFPIGFAMSEDILQKPQMSALGQYSQSSDVPLEELHGLGLIDAHGQRGDPLKFIPADAPGVTAVASAHHLHPNNIDLDDDMYFDDGMIDELGNGDAVDFDESVFDDPSGPLFERKVKPGPASELTDVQPPNPAGGSNSDTGYEADEDDLTRQLSNTKPSLAHATSKAHERPVPDFSNLNAYHSALADAAQRAEAEGRFMRKASVDVSNGFDVDDASSLSNSRPSLIPDDSRISQETTGFPPDDDVFGMGSGFVDDYDYSEYDSALEDDPMIAAANAEALANDYEGFYGQEFGFYADAQGESLNAYGGFFGSSALGRSVSGRNAVREPNLTPITERSEYSTRNSFISLNHFSPSSQPIQSPALAQLARMSPYGWREDDPDMSLETLMKLRKGAFGSSVSLSSTGNSPRNASPMGMQYVPRNASPMTTHPISRNDSSEGIGGNESSFIEEEFGGDEYDDALDAVNEFSEEDEDETGASRPESPTLTASDYNSLSSPLPSQNIPPLPPLQHQHQPLKPLPQPLTISTNIRPPFADLTNNSSPAPISATDPARHRQSLGLVSPISTNSPMTPAGGPWKAGHSRVGSGADSVTYVREQSEGGGDRWVLERRRTAESGELELIGRHIVEGGRI